MSIKLVLFVLTVLKNAFLIFCLSEIYFKRERNIFIASTTVYSFYLFMYLVSFIFSSLENKKDDDDDIF